MHIPTIIIRSTMTSYFLFDGRPIGQGGALPVAMDGLYYLCVFPLVNGFCPAAYCLEVTEKGVAGIENQIKWPGNVYEIWADPQKLYSPTPAVAIDRGELDGYLFTIFREGGVHLAVERQGELILSRTLGQTGGGTLVFDKETNSAAAIGESYCACVALSEVPKLTWTGCEGQFQVQGNVVTQSWALGTVCGHMGLRKVEMNTGKVLSEEYGFWGRQRHAPATDEERAMALLDCVKWSFEEEAMALLGSDLSSIGLTKLAEFFGDYDYKARAPLQPPDRMVIGLWKEGPLQTARCYAFEFDGDVVVNVVEI